MAANLNTRELKPPRLEPQPQPTSDVPEPHAVANHEEIARAAYFIAEARGFEPGHELDDWLAAEQQAGPA